MTPLQRLRLGLLLIAGIIASVLTVEYFRDGAHGFPFVGVGLVLLALLGYRLWHEVRQARGQSMTFVGDLQQERRVAWRLSIMLAVLVVVTPSLMLLRTVLPPGVARPLIVGSLVALPSVIIVYVMWVRLKHRL